MNKPTSIFLVLQLLVAQPAAALTKSSENGDGNMTMASEMNNREDTNGQGQYKLVDVQAIDCKDPLKAIRTYHFERPSRIEKCDVLIVGGGLGGVAAALNALMPARPGENGLELSRLRHGKKLKVILSEETDWLGGQATSQGVAALDENWLVETSGAAREYQRWRALIRRYYIRDCKLAPAVGNIERFNPGNCWVSRLSFEPKVGLAQLEAMLKPAVDAKHLRIFLRHKPIGVKSEMKGDEKHVKSVLMVDLEKGELVEFRARIVLDATELGDLLPLAGVPYVKGVEAKSDTGEEHASQTSDPENVQDIVYPFVIAQGDPLDIEPIEEPDEYEEFKSKGKLTLLGYKMFENKIVIGPDGSEREFLPFWTYRRLIDRDNFNDSRYSRDLSMINWEANDFRGGSIIDVEPEVLARRLARAKCLSIAFLLWLQTEAPRDEGGIGYPEFKLQPEVLDSKDGLSKFPYIRESRRIKAQTTIKEQDIGARYNPGARARLFDDTVGIGHYPIDIHGKQEAGQAQETKPFQIPLGSMIQSQWNNLIPACKNIGTTHITNGAYRLHPIEWAIGTAAGALSRLSLLSNRPIKMFVEDKELQLELQKHLVESGSPLFWFDDVPTWHDQFVEIQLLAIAGLMPAAESSLSFQPLKGIRRREAARALRAIYANEKFSRVLPADLPADDPDFDNLLFAAGKGLLSLNESGNVRADDLLTIHELAELAANGLVRLPRHKSIFIDAISKERLEANPDECVMRAEFALWLAMVVDYKKLWNRIDRKIARGGDVKTRKETPGLPVSTP